MGDNIGGSPEGSSNDSFSPESFMGLPVTVQRPGWEDKVVVGEVTDARETDGGIDVEMILDPDEAEAFRKAVAYYEPDLRALADEGDATVDLDPDQTDEERETQGTLRLRARRGDGGSYEITGPVVAETR